MSLHQKYLSKPHECNEHCMHPTDGHAEQCKDHCHIPSHDKFAIRAKFWSWVISAFAWGLIVGFLLSETIGHEAPTHKEHTHAAHS